MGGIEPMNLWRKALVVALLAFIWGVTHLGERWGEEAGYWLEPDEMVVLYFGTKDAEGIAPETRFMPRSQADLEGRLLALIEGPQDPRLTRSVPRSTTVRSVRVEGNRAVVDFGPEIVADHWGGSAGELITVYSVVNTLTEYDGIDEVDWRIEGAGVESLVGHYDLRYPVSRNESFIIEP